MSLARRHSTQAFATAAAVALVLAACSSPGGGDGDDPIAIGAIRSESGGYGFNQATAAAAAVFDQVNADGGINGRQIEYTTVDDGGDGGRAAQAARQLIDQDEVVALVGSESIPDCPTNAQLYADRDVSVIPALAFLPECFSSANIAPTNTGVFQGLGVTLVYAIDVLGSERPCYLATQDPGYRTAIAEVIPRVEEQTGVPVLLGQEYPPDNTNWQPYLLRAQEEGCDSFVAAAAGAQAVALEKQITDLGLRSQMDFLELNSAYSPEIAAAIQPGADGLYANAEFLPFTGSGADDPALADFLTTMEGAGIAPSGFAQSGYVAASVIVEVLQGMDGSITAETVSEALRTMDPYDTPLMGNPYEFGDADAHQPNLSSRFVQLQGDTWEPVTDEWVTLDPAQ